MPQNQILLPYSCLVNIRNPHNMQIKTITIIGDSTKDVFKQLRDEADRLMQSDAILIDFGIHITQPVTADYAHLQADTAQDELLRIRCVQDGLNENQTDKLKFYCKGWPHQKIALRFYVTPKTITSVLKRARKKSGRKTLEKLKEFLVGAGGGAKNP